MRHNRVDLTAPKTVAVNLKALLHFIAELGNIDRRIVLLDIVVHLILAAVIADVCQLLVAVGAQTNSFAYKLTRVDHAITHIVTAVNAEDFLHTAGSLGNAAGYAASGILECINNRDTPSGIRKVHHVADILKLIFIHQHISQ